MQFEPFNLDLLLLLAQTCGRLAGKIDAEKSELETRCRELADSVPREGAARTFMESLSPRTSTAEVDGATRWNAEVDAERLSSLEDTLKDAAARAAEFRRRKTRCDKLAERARQLEADLSDAAFQRLHILYADAQEKRQAADKLSREAFAGEPLSGIGEGPWRVMWQAAKRYSVQAAFPGRDFPVIEDDQARCVLCQQEIGVEARDRFARFRDFVEGEVARLAQEAEAEFAQAKINFDVLDTAQSNEVWALVEEIGPDAPGLAQLLTEFLLITGKRKETVAVHRYETPRCGFMRRRGAAQAAPL